MPDRSFPKLGVVLALWFAAAATPLAAANIPLPPIRPSDLNTPAPAGAPGPLAPPVLAPEASPLPALPTATPAESAACEALLSGGTLKAARLPAFGDAAGCGIALPVQVSAVMLTPNTAVAIEPPVTIRCEMAGVVAEWLRTDFAPLLSRRGGGLAKLSGVGGYQCRGRNRVPGAKISQHAFGNAIDITAFVLKDGSSAKITDVPHDPALFAQVKLTTCARFSTVLGPGSDGYHEDNLHLDVEPRRGGRHYCHWQLP